MKRVLICPLDWGLGHATRCIPIIRAFHREQCEVVIGGSGESLNLLRKEFPGLSVVLLPGYSPKYPGRGTMFLAMIRQLPRFMRVIADEHQALQKVLKSQSFDLLISDNRYGCWSGSVTSVLITHQSNIITPEPLRWLQPVVRWMNRRMMSHFHACWVPDLPGVHSLAGALIASCDGDKDIKFVGTLSRFSPGITLAKKYDVVVVLSGPEPQRAILEGIILPQLQASGFTWLLVRGLPDATDLPSDDRVVNFLLSEQLQKVIESADLVIARSGYSTIMDLSALGGKAVFVPTPGQTEQEYLAKRLMEKGIASYMDQHGFELKAALERSKNYPGFKRSQVNSHLEKVVRNTLHELKTHDMLKNDDLSRI